MRPEPERRCACPCHDTVIGNYREKRQQGAFAEAFTMAPGVRRNFEGVDVRDVFAAAVAQGCHCLPNHCEALVNPLPVPSPKPPWVEPYPPPDLEIPPPAAANPEE